MNKLILFLIVLLMISSCSLGNPANSNPEASLVLVESFDLDILEPSDLCYDEDSNSLWTVSDADNKVYNIDFEGNIINELPFIGNDLEGIAFSSIDSTLWLAEENFSQIVQITKQGVELARYQTTVIEGTNSGIEGITFDNDNNICIVKEKEPGKFIRLSTSFQVLQDIELDFAGDYAAISYIKEGDSFWVVSDQDERLYVWTPEDGVMAEYNLPFSKPEGIAYVPFNDSYYFVSDSLDKLYKFKLQ